MLKKILIGLAAIIVIFLIVAATRPADFRGWAVPETLRCGDHARIERESIGLTGSVELGQSRADLQRTSREHLEVVELAGCAIAAEANDSVSAEAKQR